MWCRHRTRSRRPAASRHSARGRPSMSKKYSHRPGRGIPQHPVPAHRFYRGWYINDPDALSNHIGFTILHEYLAVFRIVSRRIKVGLDHDGTGLSANPGLAKRPGTKLRPTSPLGRKLSAVGVYGGRNVVVPTVGIGSPASAIKAAWRC